MKVIRSPEAILALSTAANFGVFSLDMTRAAGISDDVVHRQVARGLIDRLLPGVFSPASVPPSWHRDCAAACAWGGESSALSHTSATALWSVDGFDKVRPIHLSLASDKKSPAKWLRVHRCDELLVPEIVQQRPLRVVSHRRALLDLAAAGHRRTEMALDYFLRNGLDIGKVWLMLDDERMRGRRGVRRLAKILSQRRPGEAPSDSDLEILTQRIIARRRLPRAVPQYEVFIRSGAVHIDLAYPRIKLGIECDSKLAHLNNLAMERDRERDIELGLQGWHILRFTWVKIKYEPDYVGGVIEHHIRTRAAR